MNNWMGFIRKTIREIPTEQQAYDAGRDAGLSGANTENCHFKYFSMPELTRAWERGKASSSQITGEP